jgi:cytochrome c553
MFRKTEISDTQIAAVAAYLAASAAAAVKPSASPTPDRL